MFTPAILPCKELIAFGVLMVAISSASTSVKEYPNALVSLRIPSAVTTTSSNSLASSAIEVFTVDLPFTPTSLVLYPKEEKTNVAFASTLME